MPYPGQSAGKHGHSEILGNPDVTAFLERCDDVPRPTVADLEATIRAYPSIADYAGDLPGFVLAIDGSTYESPVDGRYPSRRLGYVKISSVLLDMEEYGLVKRTTERFIDPMAVARLQRETDTISMALPSAYVVPKGAISVSDGFRREVLGYFRSPLTELGGETLYDTLVDLIRLLGRTVGAGAGEAVQFSVCPNRDCSIPKGTTASVRVDAGIGPCPLCGLPIYVTDALRVWEELIENGSNLEPLNRLMNAVEHILAAHYVRYLRGRDPLQLSRMCVIVDGPLALFGNPAPFHRALLHLLDEVRREQAALGLDEPLVIGLVKTGRLAEHLEMIDEIVPSGAVIPVSDDYRYRYVEPAKLGSTRNFGDDTYYGQDFFVKTERGHRFVLCVAYPFGDKAGAFQVEKSRPQNYATLGRALEVIKSLESDLYGASMIPVVLAHQHASISLRPGGKVLDIMSLKAIGKR